MGLAGGRAGAHEINHHHYSCYYYFYYYCRYDVILHDITKNRFDIMCDNRVVLDSSEADLRELNSEVTLKAMRRELQAALPNLTSETFQVRAYSTLAFVVLEF